MRPDGIVMTAPALDDDLRLAESVEDLAVEQLVPEPGIEALDIAILPGAAWSDVGGLGSDRRDPLLDGLGDELRAVVGADVARHAAQDEQVREHVDDVDGLGRIRNHAVGPAARLMKAFQGKRPEGSDCVRTTLTRSRNVRRSP